MSAALHGEACYVRATVRPASVCVCTRQFWQKTAYRAESSRLVAAWFLGCYAGMQVAAWPAMSQHADMTGSRFFRGVERLRYRQMPRIVLYIDFAQFPWPASAVC